MSWISGPKGNPLATRSGVVLALLIAAEAPSLLEPSRRRSSPAPGPVIGGWILGYTISQAASVQCGEAGSVRSVMPGRFGQVIGLHRGVSVRQRALRFARAINRRKQIR